MRSLSALVGVLLVLGSVAQSSPSKREEKVRSLLARGKAYKAVDHCTAALRSEPNPVFYVLRADGRNRIGEHQKAEQDARQGLAALPGNTEAILQLAIAEQGLGWSDSAIVHFEQALAVQPTKDGLYLLAQAHQTNKDYPQALARTDQLLALPDLDAPLRARTHRTRGECLAQTGDTAAAAVEFELALAAAPDDPVIFNSRGWFLYAQRGQHAQAIIEYDRAIRRNPNYSYAFNNRGWSRFKLGDVDGALRDIQLAKRKKSFNPYIYRNLGIIALAEGDSVAACTNFRRALDYNFTTLYGKEVEELMATSCKTTDMQSVPTQPANAPIERPRSTPPSRTNAP